MVIDVPAFIDSWVWHILDKQAEGKEVGRAANRFVY
jgi:hypothetical protein